MEDEKQPLSKRELCKSGHILSEEKFRLKGGEVWMCCERCGMPLKRRELYDCPETMLLAALESPAVNAQLPQLLKEHLSRFRGKDFSPAYAEILLAHLDEERLFALVGSGRLKRLEKDALVFIADDSLLENLCREETIRDEAQKAQQWREKCRSKLKEKDYCPDGTPHEFEEIITVWEDRGPRGDDDLAAHDYSEVRYIVCKKCGYRKFYPKQLD